MELLTARWFAASLSLCGCFGGVVDTAGHPCSTDADCGSLVCDPEAKVCIDPESATGTGEESSTTTMSGSSTMSSATTTSPTGPTSTSPSTTDESSTTGEPSTDTAAETTTGEPGELGVDDVVPSMGRTDIDRTVTVNGSGFIDGVVVHFGEDAVEVLAVSAQQIEVRVPPNAGVTGYVDVRIELDGEMVTLTDGYRRVRAMPTFEPLDVVSLGDDGSVPSAADMALGQFVGDDAIDLVVVAENGSEGVNVAEGDGAGDFTSVWNHPDPAIVVVAADVNEDGSLDFVTSGTPGLRTFTNDGLGGFTVDTYPGVIAYARGLDTLDADHVDGPDIVIRSAFEGGIQVWLNDGSGGLFAPMIYAAGDITSIDRVQHPSTGDVTGDGWDDIVTPVEPPAAPSAGFATFVNDGAGGFLAPIFTDLGNNGLDCAVGQFNAGVDDDLDVIGLAFVYNAFAMMGNGDGTFDDNELSYGLSIVPGHAEVGEFNADDANDIVYTDIIGSWAVQRGSPGGSFTLASTETYAENGANSGVAVADIDGDGLDDIVTTHYADDGTLEIHPFRNSSGD